MSSRLDFLVIGAQKCATSWIYLCLSEHAGLHLPAKKRELEYLGGDLYEARGVDWYFSLLKAARDQQKVGDVSVEYIFDPRAPKVVHQHAPHLKLIISLRDPIDRAISAYQWNMRKGRVPCLGLEEGLRTAVDESRLSQGPQIRKNYSDIINRGFYDIQLERYLEYFKSDQILFVLYEDIRERPLEVMQRIYSFLGVDAAYRPHSLTARPKRSIYLRPLIYLEHMGARSRLMGKCMDIASQWLGRLGLGSTKPTLPVPIQHELKAVYQGHVKKTQDIISLAPRDQQPFSADLSKIWPIYWIE